MSWSQELGDKILQELPEELAASTSFKVDEKERLCMFFGFKLAGPDFQMVLEVVKRYQGDFVNQKEGGRDVGFFMFPKPKPAVQSPIALANAATIAAVAMAPQEQALAPSDAKPEMPKVIQQKLVEGPKQLSPVTLFTCNFCSLCEDNCAKCDVAMEAGRFHRALCLQLLDLEQMQTLNANLEKLGKVPVSLSAQATFPAVPAPAAPVQAPPAAQPVQMVERNTRPTEGHREGDVVWIDAENQQGERYEKALDKDNAQSNEYYDIRGKIQAAEKAGKKGVVIDGKWCWLSKQGDYIGRKTAKEFPTGGRR